MGSGQVRMAAAAVVAAVAATAVGGSGDSDDSSSTGGAGVAVIIVVTAVGSQRWAVVAPVPCTNRCCSVNERPRFVVATKTFLDDHALYSRSYQFFGSYTTVVQGNVGHLGPRRAS